MGSRFGAGAPPISVYFSWDWDVHWGLTDLGFDPWPDLAFALPGPPFDPVLPPSTSNDSRG